MRMGARCTSLRPHGMQALQPPRLVRLRLGVSGMARLREHYLFGYVTRSTWRCIRCISGSLILCRRCDYDGWFYTERGRYK